jgi:hypothetical protein
VTVPSQADLKKREAKLQQFLKKLDADGKPQEKHVLSVVRGAVRQAWMKSDVKLAYLYMNTIPDMDDKTRTKWLVKCEMCGELFKLTDVEIDHKFGNHTFTKVEDFENYFNNILMVGFDDLSILCKEDHAVKTLAESQGISIESARLEKKVIAICKQPAKIIDAYLAENGVTRYAKNKDARRDTVRKLLKEKENEEQL